MLRLRTHALKGWLFPAIEAGWLWALYRIPCKLFPSFQSAWWRKHQALFRWFLPGLQVVPSHMRADQNSAECMRGARSGSGELSPRSALLQSCVLGTWAAWSPCILGSEALLPTATSELLPENSLKTVNEATAGLTCLSKIAVLCCRISSF